MFIKIAKLFTSKVIFSGINTKDAAVKFLTKFKAFLKANCGFKFLKRVDDNNILLGLSP